MELCSVEICLLLLLVAVFAGSIDAIAGGGGLLTLPALLAVGLDPVQALATNKLQGSFGTFASSLNFLHKGQIELARAGFMLLCTFAGSAAGTLSVQFVSNAWLARLIPILLILFALYFLFSPRVGELDAKQRMGQGAFALSVGFGVGFYDGFFGPGTGSLFAIAFVALLGYNLRRATAHTKLLNFSSNLASLLVFVAAGQVVWTPGLSMAAGQLFGGWLGAHLVIRHGTGLIRPLLVCISIAIAVKLLLK